MDEPLLGVHVSTSGGVITAFDRAEKLGINTFQLFVKNNKQWLVPPLEDSVAEAFRKRRKEWNKGPIVAHACYLLNLGSGNPEIQEKSRLSFAQEWLRAEKLGVDHLIFHPGSHTGLGEEIGIQNVVEGLNNLHKAYPKVKCKTVIEITAGMGSSLGTSFQQLAQILKGVKDKKRMGICLDTCHMLASGYDIRTEAAWNATFEEFDRVVGFKWLVCIHTNDSKKGLGSRVDRHEHIGKGEVGIDGFRMLMNDPRFRHIPKILETPKDDEMTEDFENLAILRGLIPGFQPTKKTIRKK